MDDSGTTGKDRAAGVAARRTALARVPDVPRLPPTRELVLRALAHWMVQYRRTWRGTAVSSVLQPLGFLAAMGLGLGVLVDRGTGATSLSGVGYLQFLAPGLLAASAMQAAAFESTYPVMGAIKWNRQYHAMLASPLRVVDVLSGHLLFVAFRLTTNVAVFLALIWLFRAVDSPWAALMLPVAVLTGVAYATPIFAFAASQDNDSGFAMLFRFGIVPMFLFSGTFFPISQLPDWLQPVAWGVPLWHGVAECRELALGQATVAMSAVHVGYLLLWAVGGFLLAWRQFTRRLVT
jgi:lipooligosaccharide transport system permease protein